MPNASNTSDVLAAHRRERRDRERAVVAVQGPEARGPAWPPVAPRPPRCTASASSRFEWGGATCLVAGTGYTGEDGVECAVPAEVAAGFWEAVLAQGIAPGRAGRPRHAAPRGGAPAARARARPGHHAAPGRAGLGRGLGQGRLHRARRPRGGAGRPARPGACAASWPTAASRLRDGCRHLPRPDRGRHPDQRQLLAHARVRHRARLRRGRCAAPRRRRRHGRPAGARAAAPSWCAHPCGRSARRRSSRRAATGPASAGAPYSGQHN